MELFFAIWAGLVLYFAHADVGDDGIVELLNENNVVSEVTDRGIAIYLPQVKFASGEFILTSETKAAITGVVDVLQLNNVSHKYAYFEGHTDRFGSDEHNYTLGLSRANAVMEAFEEEGLSSRRTESVSYGESLPKGNDPSENRRVEILLLDRRALDI